MLKYIIKRLLLMIVVIIGVVTIAFILNELTTGDAATIQAGAAATEEEIEAIRDAMGLNRPGIVRYGEYVWNLFTKLDFGTSLTTKQPVIDEILIRFPTTIKLAVLSILLAIIIGIPLGVIAAVKRSTLIDNLSMTVSLLGVSIPQFWLGLMLMYLFAAVLGWLPASGVNLGWKCWIMPVFTLGFSGAATIARTTRSSMLEVIRQDYMRTAKAKGQTGFKVVVLHGMRNALIPIITVVGNQLGHLLGGAVMVESVFSLPGLGTYLISSINGRNSVSLQGGVVFLSLVFSFVNLAVDLLYVAVDPSLKTLFSSKGRKAARKAGKERLQEKLDEMADAALEENGQEGVETNG